MRWLKLTKHEELSRETVRRRLEENELKPWRRDMWCIPEVDGTYVARMEDVLDLYAEAPDPQRPVVCFDESPTQLVGEVRQPIPAEPGKLERYDCEYRRNRSRMQWAKSAAVRWSVTFTARLEQWASCGSLTFHAGPGQMKAHGEPHGRPVGRPRKTMIQK